MLNIELLQQVRDKIATTPEAYDQGSWAHRSTIAPCGTAACVAGWTCLLSNQMTVNVLYDLADKRDWKTIEGTAQERLGLTREEADTLFDGEPNLIWPAPFRQQWSNAETRTERARVAVDYLDHVIETGKVLE